MHSEASVNSNSSDQYMKPRRLLGALLLLVALTNPAAAQQAPSSPYLRVDPERILVKDATSGQPCGECHKQETEAWRETKHAKGFESMHRTDAAKEYMNSLGFRTAKRQEALCMRCHYTVGTEKTAVAGVSCESCHGAAKDWVNVHNKFVGGAKSKADETPAATEARLGAARAAGMLTPSMDLYGVAANCFDCHTAPVERLVNESQHNGGSPKFDLVERMGKIRHNFLGGGANRETSRERKRVVFVVGRMLAYEYAIRGMAYATGDGTYAKSKSKAVKRAFDQLQEISGAARIPAVDAALAAGQKAKLTVNNNADLLAAAEQIRAAGQRFASGNNGSTLAALDAVISGEPANVATAPDLVPSAPEKSVPAPARGGAAPGSGGTAAGGGSATGGGVAPNTPASAGGASKAPSGGGSAPSNAATATHASLPGDIRSRPAWFSAAGRSGYADEECSKCHKRATAWLEDDKHQDTGARRLLGSDAKAQRIAIAYGIGVDGMKKAANICMGCHATVDESRKSAPPRENGLSCETCHGAASKYFEDHQEGGNPQKGMRALKQAADRAQVCAGCHRISDERLLAAGHSSGEKFEIAERMKKIEHWPDTKAEKGRKGAAYPAIADAALRAAFATIAQSRPIPRVSVVAGPAPSPQQQQAQPSPGNTTQPNATVNPQVTPTNPQQGAAPQPPPDPSQSIAEPAPRPRARRLGPPPAPPSVPAARSTAHVTLSLDPLPSTDKLTVEEMLLLIKKRLDKVDAAVSGRKN
jgi:predicted Fe-S protein YdhL (DUF1289 family)